MSVHKILEALSTDNESPEVVKAEAYRYLNDENSFTNDTVFSKGGSRFFYGILTDESFKNFRSQSDRIRDMLQDYIEEEDISTNSGDLVCVTFKKGECYISTPEQWDAESDEMQGLYEVIDKLREG